MRGAYLRPNRQLLGCVVLVATLAPRSLLAQQASPPIRLLPRPATPELREATAAPPLVVVTSPKDSAILPLLRAELKDLGLSVLERNPGDEPMEQPGSVIACRIIVNPGSIEVSILDQSSGRVSLREIFSQQEDTPVEARTAVLHVVELLRWHLQGTTPNSKAPEPTPMAPPSNPKDGSRWLLTVMPMGLHSPGGTKPGLGVNLDLAWMGKHLGAQLSASTLLLPNRLTSTEGTASITPQLYTGAIVVPLLDSTKGVSTSATLGLTLVTLRLRGTTNQPYQTQQDDLLTAAPLLGLRASYALHSNFAVTLSGSGLLPLRSDNVYFAERRVGSYGATIFTLGLGLTVKIH